MSYPRNDTNAIWVQQNIAPGAQSASKWILQEVRKPRRDGRALYVLLQLVKVHNSLRVTPTMEVGLSDRVWSFEDLANMIDDMIAKPAGPRVPYKKRA